MTDRYMALTVTLDQDIREDDAEAIINAIKMVKHVRSVKPHVSNWEFHTAVERARFEIQGKVRKAIWPDWDKKDGGILVEVRIRDEEADPGAEGPSGGPRVTTSKELFKLLREMRILAHEALDLADRSHGGHGYESLRSTETKKCCEVRMLIDDLRLEYTKLAEKQQKQELPKRRSSK